MAVFTSGHTGAQIEAAICKAEEIKANNSASVEDINNALTKAAKYVDTFDLVENRGITMNGAVVTFTVFWKKRPGALREDVKGFAFHPNTGEPYVIVYHETTDKSYTATPLLTDTEACTASYDSTSECLTFSMKTK